MKLTITALLGISSICVSHAQGTVLLQNNLGASLRYLFGADGAPLRGSQYSVEIFTYNPIAPGGIGTKLGETVSIGANGRFTAGQVTVPDAPPGTTATLIVRGWDITTGKSYNSASLSGVSAPFTTGILGGGGNPPTTPVSMVTGQPNGFQSFSLDAKGTVLIQNNLGAAISYVVGLDGSQAKGANYSVEVFTYDPLRAGGFGIQLGPTMTIGANGRFSGGEVAVPGYLPGSVATLILRAWDNTTGDSFQTSFWQAYSAPFQTGILGGAGSPLPKAVSMLTGVPGGLQFMFATIPEPPTLVLVALGASVLIFRRHIALKSDRSRHHCSK